MQPLQPSKNDNVSRARSERKLLTKSSKSSRRLVEEGGTANKGQDEKNEERRRRRSAMGRAKSMRHFQSSRHKDRSSLSRKDNNNDDDTLKTASFHHDNENDNDTERPQRSIRRSKSSDGAELSSKSAHVSRSGLLDERSSSHHKHRGSRRSSSRKDLLSSSKSSHAVMSRHKSMRNLKSTKENADNDMLSMSKSFHEPVPRGGRPAMARRSSLSNLTASLLGGTTSSSVPKPAKEKAPKPETAAAANAPLVLKMSKPKATGPYEGVTLIQCDVQVHGGAELAAKNRQFSIAGRATSNPFIEVWQNLPTHMVGKTKTMHKTLTPTYDESFYLQWTEKALSRCLSKSHQAKVILKVWDADRISGREAMGEVSVPVPLPEECPRVSKQWFLVDRDSARNASGRLQVSLNVMYVKNGEKE